MKIHSKNTLKNVSFMILMLQMCFVFSQKKMIIIDVGHGGNDTGAIGINSIQEKDVVLNIAKEIIRLNKTIFDDELDIYLTRYTDTLISLSDRGRLTKKLDADVFVSLHCNHSDNPMARGIEVYVANIQAKYSQDSVWLAFQLQDILKKKLGFESRGVKFANFQVLRETTNYCTSVLLELGFLSNWDEGCYLKKKENYNKVSLLILNYLTSLNP